MVATWRSPRTQFILALGFSTLVSAGLFAYTALRNHSLDFDYLLWNLFLAWVPFFFTLRLVYVLRYKLWSSWEALALSVLWLIFLPNSFYMISDFIHLQGVVPGNVLLDTVMFTSFIYTGVLLGFTSLYMVHLELRKRFSERGAAGWVAVILLLCSGAIYIGRDLRWNSWSLVTDPGGPIFDVTDRLTHIGMYPQVLSVVLSFFVLLLSMYGLAWYGARMLAQSTQR